MGKHSKIVWTDHTFNPWYGCQRVSPGCNHCYAESWAKRSGLVQWGEHAKRNRSSPAYWRRVLKWNDEAERLGIRYRVFCASLADVFDNAVPPEWRADLFSLITDTPHLDWLLLTKRISNAEPMLAETAERMIRLPDNCWLGITVCTQSEADRDIPKLLSVPTAGRFLSIEPLLEQINIEEYLLSGHDKMAHEDQYIGSPRHDDRIYWVIVGGETGPKARPMHPDWVRSIRDQCTAADVPFFFKQWGEWVSAAGFHGRIHWTYEDPKLALVYQVKRQNALKGYVFDDLYQMVRVGKKAAGCMLDGVEHKEFPKWPTLLI
jgi:protein gp37